MVRQLATRKISDDVWAMVVEGTNYTDDHRMGYAAIVKMYVWKESLKRLCIHQFEFATWGLEDISYWDNMAGVQDVSITYKRFLDKEAAEEYIKNDMFLEIL